MKNAARAIGVIGLIGVSILLISLGVAVATLNFKALGSATYVDIGSGKVVTRYYVAGAPIWEKMLCQALLETSEEKMKLANAGIPFVDMRIDGRIGVSVGTFIEIEDAFKSEAFRDQSELKERIKEKCRELLRAANYKDLATSSWNLSYYSEKQRRLTTKEIAEVRALTEK